MTSAVRKIWFTEQIISLSSALDFEFLQGHGKGMMQEKCHRLSHATTYTLLMCLCCWHKAECVIIIYKISVNKIRARGNTEGLHAYLGLTHWSSTYIFNKCPMHTPWSTVTLVHKL